MGRNYWMVVATPEDFEVTRRLGLSISGVGSKYRRRAQRMQPDDRMLFYVTKIRKWTAIATITSTFFEDRKPIWKPSGRGETYPFRVKTKPFIVLEEPDYIDALWLAPGLEYVKRWAPEDWPLAFFDMLHLLPQRDFRLIENEMKRINSNRNTYKRLEDGIVPVDWNPEPIEDYEPEPPRSHPARERRHRRFVPRNQGNQVVTGDSSSDSST